MKHLYYIYKNLVNTLHRRMKEQRRTALWYNRWTDAWWKAAAACTAKGLRRDQTHRRQQVIKSQLSYTSSLVNTDLLSAGLCLVSSQCYSEISFVLGVYSTWGLFGVICWLACSSCWSAEWKDLTLSKKKRKGKCHVSKRVHHIIITFITVNTQRLY